jgi:hypothetical protein
MMTLLLISVNGVNEAYAQSPEYLTFESAAHGIALQYPSSWDKYDGVEQGVIVNFYSPFENDADQYSENFGIYFDSLAGEMPLEEYAAAVISAYSRIDGFELVSNSSVTLAGRPALELVFTTELSDEFGELVVQSKHTLMLKDGRGYIFSYNAEQSKYSDYLSVANDILASVSLRSSGPIDEEEEFLQFQSNTRGIKIQYPSGWEVVEDPSDPSLVVKFVSPATNQFDYQEAFQIYSERIPSVWSLDDYVKVTVDSVEEYLGTELNVIESSNTNLGGNQARRLVYSAPVNGTDSELQVLLIFTIKSGTAYTINFVTATDLYPGFVPTLEKMIGSFAFVSVHGRDTGPTQYLSYANSTYSIQSVRYPDNWILIEPTEINTTEVDFYSPNFDASVSVGYFDLGLPAVSLSEYSDYHVSELKKRVTLFNLISSNQTTLAGEPAQMIVFKGHLQVIGDKLFPYKLMEVLTIKDGRAYIITYATFEELFPTYLPLADNIIDSFEPDETNAPKVLSGTYHNPELGLNMRFPENWAGIQKQEGGVTDVIVSAEGASLTSDYSSMAIVSGSDDDLADYFDRTSDRSVSCTSDRTLEIVNLAGAKALRYETSCDRAEHSTYYTYYIRGPDQSVYLFHSAPDNSGYAETLPKFHESVSTITLPSAVDLSDIDEYAKYSGLENQLFRVEAAGEEYDITVATNSSITNFEFNEEEKKLSITLDGKNGTSGETYLAIGTILEGDYDVFIDGESVNETDERVSIIDDQTTNQTFISIAYTHSEHSITIIGTNVVPEFPVPAMFIVAMAVLAIITVAIRNGKRTRLWGSGVYPA